MLMSMVSPWVGCIEIVDIECVLQFFLSDNATVALAVAILFQLWLIGCYYTCTFSEGGMCKKLVFHTKFCVKQLGN